MSEICAWQWIINHWSCSTWTPIDSVVRAVLNINSTRGMCGGVICTKKSSDGMSALINRINNHKEN